MIVKSIDTSGNTGKVWVKSRYYENRKYDFERFKQQPHKMVKHNQTIRRLLPTNCLSLFDHFVGLALRRLTTKLSIS